MRALLIIAAMVVASGCSRPLTDAEARLAKDLFGDEISLKPVRVAQGLGIAPLYRTVPTGIVLMAGTERSCVRTPQPLGAQPPQAFALWNRMHFDSTLYASDMALGWPNGMRFPQALVLAHELTHVWQWQNRDRTGYTPRRAVAESWSFADPYFSASGETVDFFRLGYEQQAAVVEDFVCFTVANPDHPRRAELRTLLEPVLDVGAFEDAVRR